MNDKMLIPKLGNRFASENNFKMHWAKEKFALRYQFPDDKSWKENLVTSCFELASDGNRMNRRMGFKWEPSFMTVPREASTIFG